MSEKEMSLRAVRAHLPALVDRAERGETTIITRHGQPKARIAALETHMITYAVSRDTLDAWLGDHHGLTEEGISTLLEKAIEICRRWPDADDTQRRMDRLWWAYQEIVTAAAPSRDEALETIHGKGRTGTDPFVVAESNA